MAKLEKQRSLVITLRLCRGPTGNITQSSDHLTTLSWFSWRHNPVQWSYCDRILVQQETTQSSDHIATISWSNWRQEAVQRSPWDCAVVQLETQRSPGITFRLYRGQIEDTTQSSDHIATVSGSSWRHNAVQ